MIQRKQTIYLLLAFICMVLVLLFPIFHIHSEAAGESLDGTFGAHGMYASEGNVKSFPLYLLFISLAILSAAGIMLFKNRKKQLLLTRINLILHILVAFSVAVFYYVGTNILTEDLAKKGYENVTFEVGVGFFLIVATVPFIILAIRGIKQDEQLLKSIDRIR